MDLSCLFIPVALVYSVLFIDCISHCMEPIRMKFNNSISCRVKQCTHLISFCILRLKKLSILLIPWMNEARNMELTCLFHCQSVCLRTKLSMEDKILHGKYFSFFKMKSDHALHFLKVLRLTSTLL